MATYYVKKYWREATIAVLYAVPLFAPAFFSLLPPGRALTIHFWLAF